MSEIIQGDNTFRYKLRKYHKNMYMAQLKGDG